jgi:hypothetical protein
MTVLAPTFPGEPANAGQQPVAQSSASLSALASSADP